MEYSGLGGPDAPVVCRGNPEDGGFLAFRLDGGRVVAGMNVDVWGVTEPIRALIRSGRPVPVDRLTDPHVRWRNWSANGGRRPWTRAGDRPTVTTWPSG